MSDLHQYLLEHQTPYPGRLRGLIQMNASDFGAAEPPPAGNDQALWHQLVAEASDRVKQARLLNAEWSPGTLEAADEALDVVLATEPSLPPPPTPRIQVVYGTYAGHGLAKDAYGGYTPEQLAWGPHHNIPIKAPVDGRVELYQIGTPLAQNAWILGNGMNPLDYRVCWASLSSGWTCMAGPLQTMFVAVFWPASTLVIDNVRIGHLHYGHVHQDVKTGPVAAGDTFALSWDSGIRWEPSIQTRAAHTHCCAGAGSTLSPNGDLDGTLAIKAQGWNATALASVPGPLQYQSGQYCAGRLRNDFTAAGKPIPPMPSS